MPIPIETTSRLIEKTEYFSTRFANSFGGRIFLFLRLLIQLCYFFQIIQLQLLDFQ